MSTSTVVNKLATERNQRLVLELASKPGNDVCADCKARNPRWASFNLGIFICVSCASIHRKIGTHITKVKSLTLDSWTKEQVDRMKEMGNIKSNAIYNPNEVRNPPPPRLDDPGRDNDLEQYIRSKYEYRRFVDKSAFVATKLGPSRSASSVNPRAGLAPARPPAKPASTPPEPKTATDIAATMFSTTKPQLQPRAPLSQPAHPALRSLPTRSASQPLASQNNSIASSAAAKPQGVWADLISLQEPSANASLPLQYQTSSMNPGGNTPSSTMPTGLSGTSINPFSNMTGLSTTGSPAAPFPQQSFAPNPFAQQQAFAHSGSLSPFPPSAPAPSFQSTPSQIPSAFSPSSSSPLYSTQALQTSPAIPFYQPQPQQSTLAPSQSQPQFLSSSPNPQFMPSHSPQLLSTTPTAQQNPGFNTGAGNGIGGFGGGAPGYLTPSPQPTMHGQAQVSSMGVQPNQLFGGGFVAQSQQTPTMSNNNPFGQMQFGQGGFPNQGASQWGPL
ncbi:hypothetical protein D9756_008690 [Leucocoprinus leucothites]|uniref:Arf-GAP domain-containing protein n=1 Tax=Leucocoprinus leucothites TaxID=201217 RepID=A0A8H5FVX3_9AGAR|nr:hypothetical protein D9756_008690 [Leucoagaricus leucothites]